MPGTGRKWAAFAALISLSVACRGVSSQRVTNERWSLDGTSVHIRPAVYSKPPVVVEWSSNHKEFTITVPAGLDVRVSAADASAELQLDPNAVNTVAFTWVDYELVFTATNGTDTTTKDGNAHVSTLRRLPTITGGGRSNSQITDAIVWTYFDGIRTSFRVTEYHD